MKKLFNKIKEFFKRPKVKKALKVVCGVLGTALIGVLGITTSTLIKENKDLKWWTRCLSDDLETWAGTSTAYYSVLKSKNIETDAKAFRDYCFDKNGDSKKHIWFIDESNEDHLRSLPCTFEEWEENRS